MTWAPDYASATQLRHFLRIPDATTDDANEMGFALTAASRAVDLVTNRQFGTIASAVARYYIPFYDRETTRWMVDIDDLMTVTSLVVKSGVHDSAVYGTTETDFIKTPLNAAAESKPWTRLVFGSGLSMLERDLEVMALWGWTAVPSTVIEATLLQAARLLKRRDAPFGVAGSPDMGSEIRLLARVDPDVAVVLKPYIRWWGAV